MTLDPNAEEIAKHRAAIDGLDERIVELLNERASHARAIGELKGNDVVYRPEREAQVLRHAASAGRGPLPAESIGRVFTEIVSVCRAFEQRPTVAFLGPPGTFSEMALLKAFGSAVDAVACASIDEVFRQAEAGGAGFAIVPVENSTEGSIGRTLDLLLQTPLRICAEVMQRVRQNLLSRSGSTAGVTRIYSHAQSLAQCHGWLAQNLPGVERVQAASNAEAARMAASEDGAAAIAGEIAASRYGLAFAARDIEDDPNNTTRFLVLGHHDPAPSGSDRTSLVVSAPNRPGAVHALITPFAEHGVSMRKIESRPAPTGMWEYVFYIDLEGHQRDPEVAAALAELKDLAPFLKILGSYPAAVL
ncbi:MAG: prephenate dehydratase [Betaproteobacteria bacterium]|nr:prephenate dehydratase [Betaproteobacteria bacterium]MBI2961796.1 prephenate dehydratase [Betaproteobacteria bacterium]